MEAKARVASTIVSVIRGPGRESLGQRALFAHLVREEMERCDADQYESHQPDQLERDPEYYPHCPHVPTYTNCLWGVSSPSDKDGRGATRKNLQRRGKDT